LSAHVAALPVVKPDDPQSFKDALALREKFGNIPNLSMPGVKVFADGVVEYPSQSAAMTVPYRNTGKMGDLLFKPENFARLCIDADKLGMFVHTHAIGDLAVHEALNGYEAMRKANGDSGLPASITHLQFVRPGEIAGASDWPVSTPDVFKAIYQAETRKGETGEALNAAQAAPRESMLYAYTINAARTMRQAETVGSIEPGKAADFALVDRDVLAVPAEQVRDTKVLATMVAGEWVYRSN
jgi:hypothetical protein